MLNSFETTRWVLPPSGQQLRDMENLPSELLAHSAGPKLSRVEGAT